MQVNSLSFVKLSCDVVFKSVRTSVHLGRFCGNSVCFGLSKSFCFAPMIGSGLFKPSFLVVTCFKTLTKILFINFSCHSYVSLRNVGRLLATFVSVLVASQARTLSLELKYKLSAVRVAATCYVSEQVAEICTMSLEMDT